MDLGKVRRGCLPFLIASAGVQGTMRSKICDVSAFFGAEIQKDRVALLLSTELAIAGGGLFLCVLLLLCVFADILERKTMARLSNRRMVL